MGFALVFLGGFFLSAVLFSSFFHNVMFGCLRVEFFFILSPVALSLSAAIFALVWVFIYQFFFIYGIQSMF